MNPVVILGAGGLGKEVLWVLRERARQDGSLEPMGFLDDDPALAGSVLCDLPVLGTFSWLEAHQGGPYQLVSAVCPPSARRRIAARASSLGYRFVTLVDPTARLSPETTLGEGTVVMAGCTLTPQVSVGRLALLNLHSTIGHDTRIGDFTIVDAGAHIAGEVVVGEGCEIGTGASIREGVHIGWGTVISAGAAVQDHLPPCVAAAGVPARIVERNLDA